MRPFNLIFSLLVLFFAQAGAQGPLTIEGYVYEENDRGFLKDAEVQLFTSQMMKVEIAQTDIDGHFKFVTTDDRDYVIRINKKLYIQNEQKVRASEKNEENKIFLKAEMEREPGYIFDVTLAEPRPAPDAPTNSVEGATIEIYNNTTKKMEWVSEDHPSPYFKFTFQQGNHYTIMISKKRYITKQIEAYVNVHGCIVCIEGVDNVKPGVVDNLTEGHQKGTLLANIEMRPVKIGEKIPIGELYYKSGRYSVTKSMYKPLDELIVLLVNNPSLIVDLRSHTDSQGDDKFNMNLSLKRANEAVNYILKHSRIDKYRLKAIGMGETSPVNKCKNNVPCSERQLAMNRRTELVITGLLADKFVKKPLTKKMEEERMAAMLEEVMGGEQIEIPAGGEMPEELKKKIEEENRLARESALNKEKKLETNNDFGPPASEEDFDDRKETKVEKIEPTVTKEKVRVVSKEPKKIEEKVASKKKETIEEVEKKVASKKKETLEEVEEKVASKKKETLEEVEKEVEKIEVVKPKMKTPKKAKKISGKEADNKMKAAEERAKKAFQRSEDLPREELNPPKKKVQKIEKEKGSITKIEKAAEKTAEKVVSEKETSSPREEIMPKAEETKNEASQRHGKIVSEVDLSKDDVARNVPAAADDYTGYSVQVKRSPYELPNSDIIFEKYSDVYFYRALNGDYIYFTGNFATRTIGEVGLKYVKRSYPRAKLRLFKNGKLVKK